MDSEDSRGSSANESEDESPGSPDSAHSRPRSRQSNASRSRSPSKGSRSNSVESGSHNGPRSPSAESNRSRSRSSSASSRNRSRSRSVPDAPKSPSEQGSRSVSRNSPRSVSRNSPRSISRNSPSPQQSPKRLKSPVSCPQSPEAAVPSIESLNKSKSKQSIGSPDSMKSGSSRSSKRSRSRSSKRSRSRSSSRSSSSSSSRRPSRRKSRDGNTSDSSVSSIDSSSRKNKSKADTQPEEISEGDMESEDDKEVKKKRSPERQPEINISHEDLSDVSDLDDSIGAHSEDDKNDKENDIESKDSVETLQQNRDTRKSPSVEKKTIEKTRTDEAGEEQLDFEAEDGECNETDAKESGDDAKDETKEEGQLKEDKKPEKNREDLEEGEVTDEDDVRPEETEPRPVCRFFSRGACTWGASCRFLHPGVTDKGNYTMFDMVRPILPGADFMGGPADRIYGKPEPPVVESAWERGLRTAKEMLRKSMKRKEQDIDFEEKKMNLSIAQEEFDKENGYVYGRGASPEPRYVRHMAVEYPTRPLPPEDYYQRRQVPYEQEYPPPHARDHRPPPRSYRELPPHRMPDYYNTKYDEQPPAGDRGGGGGAEADRSMSRRKPKREVIVQQRDERPSRGDEWADPWMRSKSPGRRKDRKRSYSSGSSTYSSSSSRSSSASTRSSFRSRSKSPRRRGSRPKRSKRVSPSVIVSERKAANERAALMNPPAPKRRAPSPGMMRVSAAANPPAPSREDPYGRSRKFAAGVLARLKGHRRSRSSSGSSSGSSSDSDSSDSSSSSSKSPSPEPRRASEIVKAMDALKSNTLERTKIKLNLKSPMGMRKPDLAKAEAALASKKRPANSPPGMDKNSKKATSRREELLKQLKAVEDAIAKKRSKVN